MSDKITVAQALRRVKKLKGQIAEHYLRAQQSVSYEKGKEPAFRYGEQTQAMKAAQAEMVDLQSRIAIANAKATVQDGAKTLTHAEAIRVLQELKGEIAFLRGLVLRNDVVKGREQMWDDVKATYVFTPTETTFVSDLSEKERDTQVKGLQDYFERLNNALEDHNHKVAV
jgi:hypothetical protein